MPKPPKSSTVSQTLLLAALSLLSAAGLQVHAQSAPPLNRNIIVLDPAHGGTDIGARISDALPEKQVTLAFAARLKPLLVAAGFTVLSTRDADPTDIVPLDQRAGTANHARALACLLLHATASGTGVHLFTSSLASTPASTPSSSSAVSWDQAQVPYLAQSQRLANELGVALLHARIQPLLGRSSVRPIDNLTCPAVALEIAPLAGSDSDATPVSDATYQQNVAKAITEALVAWRNHAAPPARTAPAKPAAAPATTPPPAPTPGATR